MGIPKQLHQIWIGPDQRPDHLIKTWHDKHKDWSHLVWDETMLDKAIDWSPGARKVYDQYIRDQRYCGATNVARVLILNQYGGVYVDADIHCRHSLDGAWFMEHENWISQSPHDPERFQNAAMGAVQGSSLMSMIAFDLDMVSAQGRPIHPSWQTTGAVQIKNVYDNTAPKQDLAVVPSPAFHPQQKNRATNPALWTYTGIIYADHFFYSTHGRKLPA